MDVSTWVHGHGGVVRTPRLRDAGFSAHQVGLEVSAGTLVRVRRGWISTRDADAELVAAARHGVVVTCVSAARRMGLWVVQQPGMHVAAPSHAGRMTAGSACTVHWDAPWEARHPDALVDSLINMLVLVALCQPFDAARTIWESAIRKGLVEQGHLTQLELPAAARRVRDTASPFSDSGLETLMLVRLAWLRLPVRQQVFLHGHCVDFLIGARLVVQIDGWAHHRTSRDRNRDIAHDAQLTLAGYTVLRVSYDQVMNRWEEVHGLIVAAVARSLHLARR